MGKAIFRKDFAPRKITELVHTGVVMQAKPHRGIPQAELDKLQQLRERLAQLKVSTKDI